MELWYASVTFDAVSLEKTHDCIVCRKRKQQPVERYIEKSIKSHCHSHVCVSDSYIFEIHIPLVFVCVFACDDEHNMASYAQE